MKKIIVLVMLAYGSFSTHAEQLSTEDIFSKAKRTLPKPPESLTSKTTSMKKRVQSEMQRYERALASTDIEGQDEPLKDNSDLYNSDESGENAPSKGKRKRGTSRAQNRAFSIGFVGGSSYGIFGVETNLGLGHPWEIGGGLGTGFSYTTWGLHTRYFFLEENLTPYFQAGYTNWRVRKPPSRGEMPNPNYLSDRFFENKSGDIPKAVTRHLIYPGIGVLFQNESGLALTALIQYLVSLNNFSGALYGGVGIHLYF